MEEAYNKLFNLKDETDREDSERIAQLPDDVVIKMREYLKEWVTLIRLHKFVWQDFERFKLDLMEFGAPELCIWDTANSPKMPKYVMFDLNWQMLTSAKACYVAALMLGNTRVDIPRVADKSIWSVIQMNLLH